VQPEKWCQLIFNKNVDKMLVAAVKDIPILLLPTLELCNQKNGAN